MVRFITKVGQTWANGKESFRNCAVRVRKLLQVPYQTIAAETFYKHYHGFIMKFCFKNKSELDVKIEVNKS